MNHFKGGIYKRFIKRSIDLILSIIGIIILFPVFLLIALFVKVKLGSPILFKQERPGLNEKIFTMYKFRTMTDERDENGILLPDSQRLTRFGKFLRSTSLDELPEIINIIKGDMSIIGPRPLLVSYLPYYTDVEKIRHTVRPGLTGLAQVSGRNFIDWDNRLKKDVEYVLQCNFLLDLKIFIKTILIILKKEDIAVDTKTVESNFAEQRKQKVQ